MLLSKAIAQALVDLVRLAPRLIQDRRSFDPTCSHLFAVTVDYLTSGFEVAGGCADAAVSGAAEA